MSEHERAPRASLVLHRRGGAWESTGTLTCRVGDGPRDGPDPLHAGWAWDGRRLRISNDRYGIAPMYASVAPDRVILSTSLEDAVRAGAPADFDEDALAVLLRLGWLVGDDTPLAAVRRLPPGLDLSWDSRDEDGSLRLRGGPFVRRASRVARTAAIDAYVELFRCAMERNLADGDDSRLLLPLSGGRDSRHILLALREADATPDEAVTVRHIPPKPNEDARVASLLAAAVGIRHRILPRSGRRIRDEVRKNALTDFAAPSTHTWSVPLVDYLADYRGLVFDGFAGDVLSMGRYLQPEELRLFGAGRLEALADRLLGNEDEVRAMLSPAVYGRLSRDRAVARLVRELALHVDAANPVRSFRFWSYGRRLIGTSGYGMFLRNRVRLPYLDERLFDFLASLPPDVLLEDGGHFHTAVIARAYPDCADIPYEDPGASAVHDTAYFRRIARAALAHLVREAPAGDLHTRRFLVPRLLRTLADPRYAAAAGWLVPRAVYSTQLGRTLERASGNAKGRSDGE